jgi:hypothetical protein
MTMMLRSIRAPVSPESELVQGDWRDTDTTLQPIRARVGPVYVIMPSVDGLAS